VDLSAFQRRFALRVRSLREARGLRQEDLENFGLSWKSVQKVEYGQTDPKASTLLKLCAAFEVTLPELLTLDSPTRELAKPERADS
jgi:transcriptional regulator with XRE-family HTH domain